MRSSVPGRAGAALDRARRRWGCRPLLGLVVVVGALAAVPAPALAVEELFEADGTVTPVLNSELIDEVGPLVSGLSNATLRVPDEAAYRAAKQAALLDLLNPELPPDATPDDPLLPEAPTPPLRST